jgi:hypothetical protein
MRTYKLATRKFDVLDTVKCNQCGRIVSINDLDPDPYHINQFHAFEILGGYGSEFDYQKVNFDICDDCLQRMIVTMQVPPDIEQVF